MKKSEVCTFCTTIASPIFHQSGGGKRRICGYQGIGIRDWGISGSWAFTHANPRPIGDAVSLGTLSATMK
jgi:hypothetical protein